MQAKINSLELEINRDSYLDRKQRTRRLIQKGALAEKYFNIEHLTVEETEEVFKIFSAYVQGNLPNKFKKKDSQSE
ncbi:hypothetical protein ACFPU1_16760 [Thalassorhabdus alkalitolerans]|uniref:DUF3847 domain-containing protein n=1 Tax=Thalassorhabdus alkalitolerans TaxID=2282697 RepID=A0ABW0YPI9_9BACI